MPLATNEFQIRRRASRHLLGASRCNRLGCRSTVTQGKGIGSALWSVVLTVCDSQKVTTYLAATRPRNVPLYERHGFEAVGSIQAADSPHVAQTKTDVLTMLVHRYGSADASVSALSHRWTRMLQSVRQAVQRVERRRLLEG